MKSKTVIRKLMSLFPINKIISDLFIVKGQALRDFEEKSPPYRVVFFFKISCTKNKYEM